QHHQPAMTASLSEFAEPSAHYPAPNPNLRPQAHAASPFSPPPGSRCRQADEGQRALHQRQFT
ncbi:hypothetical protein CN153_31870, partial [Sinorhizobium meliloti]